MPRRNRISILLCVFLFIFSAAGVSSGAERTAPLRFLSGPPGGNWFALGNALAGIWRESVLPTNSIIGGAVSNLTEIDSGRADLGFSVTSIFNAAVKGEGGLDKMDNIAVLGVLYGQYTYFVAGKAFAQKNRLFFLSDLFENKLPVRLAVLKPGTGSEFIVRALLEKSYGATYRTIENNGGKVLFCSYEGGAEMLANGQVDVFAFSVGHNSAILAQIRQQLPVEVIQISNSALRALARAYGTETFLLEPAAHQGVVIPTRTVGDYTCIVVRKDLPDDLVYQLCEVMWQNKNGLSVAVQDMRELDPGRAAPSNIAVHPGAERFWQEQQK